MFKRIYRRLRYQLYNFENQRILNLINLCIMLIVLVALDLIHRNLHGFYLPLFLFKSKNMYFLKFTRILHKALIHRQDGLNFNIGSPNFHAVFILSIGFTQIRLKRKNIKNYTHYSKMQLTIILSITMIMKIEVL